MNWNQLYSPLRTGGSPGRAVGAEVRTSFQTEIAGYNVIGGLLREFIGAILQRGSIKSQKLKQLISKQFVIAGRPDSLYPDIQAVVDFIAGMTDLYAVDLYRKITGIDFPRIR